MSQDNLKDLADFVDTTHLLQGKESVSKAVAGKRSTAMLKALQLPCELKDARHVASGTRQVDGKAADVGLYEVACANGMGYLLTSVDLSSASGMSCFAAAAATQARGTSDSAKLDLRCSLPANQNLNSMATAVMHNAGAACDVHEVKWLGQSPAPRLDYTEVACNDAEGFILRTPVPGSAGNIDVVNCKDAASQGAQCQLSGAAAGMPSAAASATPEPRPNLKWFEDQLAKNAVQCDVKNARIIGRETIKRRYIVEFQCAGQPRGLVAYFPAEGDATNKFEKMDCEAAIARQLTCQYPGPRD